MLRSTQIMSAPIGTRRNIRKVGRNSGGREKSDQRSSRRLERRIRSKRTRHWARISLLMLQRTSGSGPPDTSTEGVPPLVSANKANDAGYTAPVSLLSRSQPEPFRTSTHWIGAFMTLSSGTNPAPPSRESWPRERAPAWMRPSRVSPGRPARLSRPLPVPHLPRVPRHRHSR
jgi:hypothetical protein